MSAAVPVTPSLASLSCTEAGDARRVSTPTSVSAIAAAVLGDADRRQTWSTWKPLTASPRLQSGSIDVLVRNTTWTASRDGGEAATFVADQTSMTARA